MAWQQYLPDDRLKWTHNWNSLPIWPTEPDVSVMKNLVWSNYAPPDLAHSESPQDKEQLEVEFLADGAHPQSSLVFRVAIPIDPTLKIESEVSTFGFLREQTTIPVPRCVAWGLAADSELGYDWCLMEKVHGVELRDVWRKMSWERKLELTDKLAAMMSQLWKPEHKFAQIGSIYASEQITDSASTTAHGTVAGDATATRYVVGPAIDSCFYSGRRRYLESHRGPFPSCGDWLSSQVKFEREDWKYIVEDELEIEGEDEFREEYDEAIKTAQAYLDLLSETFPPPEDPEQPRFSLYHPDLRAANIFSAMTLPDWYGREYPLLLRAPDPLDERLPPIPETYDEEDERYNAAMVASRDRWDLRLLRKRYDEALVTLGWKDWRPESTALTAKTFFLEGASVLSTNPESAKRRLGWVRRSLDGEEEEESEEEEEEEEREEEKEEEKEEKEQEKKKEEETRRRIRSRKRRGARRRETMRKTSQRGNRKKKVRREGIERKKRTRRERIGRRGSVRREKSKWGIARRQRIGRKKRPA
ncbi:hypothetical protein F5144DRAFT_622646 [Chaetomium tenue]|uniref:Uncharacterized protein n=1 Tax=Chaetomium tenue TaxID=1854479 RepID=A0ACB7P6R2_9PEZI|nr:hypothetical protein F5144DRAFT_622646 [Chaetomium globosum]